MYAVIRVASKSQLISLLSRRVRVGAPDRHYCFKHFKGLGKVIFWNHLKIWRTNDLSQNLMKKVKIEKFLATIIFDTLTLSERL